MTSKKADEIVKSVIDLTNEAIQDIRSVIKFPKELAACSE